MRTSDRRLVPDSELHDYCKWCRKNCLAKVDSENDSKTGKPVWLKGEFVIECSGIPKLGSTMIPSLKEVKEVFGKDEIEELERVYNPIIWNDFYAGWEPRIGSDYEDWGPAKEYQYLMIMCDAKRKATRLGRRLGKTESIKSKILHLMYNNSPKSKRYDHFLKKEVKGKSNVVVLTPSMAQVKDIFDKLWESIQANPVLKEEASLKVTPFYQITLKSGFKVKGFTSGSDGAKTLRGQGADWLFLDETDYLSEDDIHNVVALLMEHAEVELWASSTPTGLDTQYKAWCLEDPTFKEFHFPSMINPYWNPRMEMELRGLYTTKYAWNCEILAEFGDVAQGLFRHTDIDICMGFEDYVYEHCQRSPITDPSKKYSIGVDWNGTVTGVRIRVLEADLSTFMIKCVDVAEMSNEEFTQTKGVQKVIDMNRKWRADWIYVDEGYGTTQIELLHQVGQDALEGRHLEDPSDKRLAFVKPINFRSTIEVYDPFTKQPVKKPMKGFLVENAVRRIEQHQLIISPYDLLIQKQMQGYRIEKFGTSGIPIYECSSDGDHDLDALMLALCAFQMELSGFGKPNFNYGVAFSQRIGAENQDAIQNAIQGERDKLIAHGAPGHRQAQSRDISLEPDKVNYKTGRSSVTGKQVRLYNPGAFTQDTAGAGLTHKTTLLSRRRRGKMGGGRSNF